MGGLWLGGEWYVGGWWVVGGVVLIIRGSVTTCVLEAIGGR